MGGGGQCLSDESKIVSTSENSDMYTCHFRRLRRDSSVYRAERDTLRKGIATSNGCKQIKDGRVSKLVFYAQSNRYVYIRAIQMAENVASSSRVLHSKHCVLFLRQYNQQGRYTQYLLPSTRSEIVLSSLICLQPQIVAISFLKVSFSLLCTHLSLLWADENDTCTCRYPTFLYRYYSRFITDTVVFPYSLL